MTARHLALMAATAWVGYAWVPHLLTPCLASRGARKDRRVALTFDDGPDPAWTPRLLDLLARRGIRGTFFLIGERAARAPDVVRAIDAAGHEIGNHTWSHRSLWLCGPRRTSEEIGRAQACLADLLGRSPRHFRPPWGMLNAAMPSALRRAGVRCVLWSIQPEGFRPAAAEVQAARVVRLAHPGAIVDLHDAEGTPGAPARLLEAMPPMLDGLARAGYGFATVAELLAPDPRRAQPAGAATGSA